MEKLRSRELFVPCYFTDFDRASEDVVIEWDLALGLCNYAVLSIFKSSNRSITNVLSWHNEGPDWNLTVGLRHSACWLYFQLLKNKKLLVTSYPNPVQNKMFLFYKFKLCLLGL